MTGGLGSQGSATPMVILIGGRMTVDDGSELDSRQAVAGDPKSEIVQRCLAGSLSWWQVVASVVDPILDASGEDAFALVIGRKTVVELNHDGSLRRVRLRSILPGGSSDVDLVRTSLDDPLPEGYTKATTLRSGDTHVMGTVGFKPGERGSRWRFVTGNPYYLEHAGRTIGPKVVVDTSDSTIGFSAWETSEAGLLEERYGREVVIVRPHTNRAERWIHPDQPSRYWDVNWESPDRGYQASGHEWDPNEPPDPAHHTFPVVVEADFGVTGLLQNGEWRDPSDLEAARSLLQARYDLKIGIWDLVNNPTLRRTLLNSAPVQTPPSDVAEMPPAATSRAERQVAIKMEERAATSDALSSIATRMEQLTAIGWINQREGDFRLGLTEPLHRWPGDKERPLVELWLSISKRRMHVSALIAMYNQIDLRAYVLERRDLLESIAAPESCDLEQRHSPVLWRADQGWADPVNWERQAARLVTQTEAWTRIFAPLVEESRRIVQERNEYLESH